ncbi:pseudouridine synthase [Desulfovibrio sp.]|uniref:pseudouridine synthase n=1 Tax=Desulfovibrio sp. TaxID=885 RepID=UPI0025C0A21F|nr:pseudouridine synthase [Desulfovibrio sp.]
MAKPGLELPKENTHADGQRLNKAIAASGLCARRKADELIFAGRVAVDGMTETNPGRRVGPGEIISVDGKPLSRKQELAYRLLNKPVGIVCTLSDPQGRPTVMDILPESARGLGLFPVGRLDFFSEGLLLLTNDGELANRLTHPRHHVDKTYEVLVRGPVPEQALETMRAGMRLSDGTPLLPVAASRVEGGDERGTLLRLVLRQGVNRQIRRMCDDLGLTILRLKRVAQGILRLGELKPGETRVLKAEEVRALRKSAALDKKP